jgi:hypothetical protein
MISLFLIGLFYAVAGTAIYARGHAYAPAQAYAEMVTGRAPLSVHYELRIDARFGLGLLIAGFAFMALGQVRALNTGTLIMLALSGLIATALYYLLMRELLAEQEAEALAAAPQPAAPATPALLENAGQPVPALPTPTPAT